MSSAVSTVGKVQCPHCGRWADCLFRIEGDPDFAGCADCIRQRRRERKEVSRCLAE